jgi:ABC-type phosphate/phosphonate transport system substrate-binding protein
MNLFRAALAPFASSGRYFDSVRFSGSHKRSVELLATREADVTAVDCVSFAHMQRLWPDLTANVKVLDWTPPSPCLPFVTSRSTSAAIRQELRSAMKEVFADEQLAPVRERLLLNDIDLAPDTTCGRVADLEREAEQRGYPTLL